MVVIKRILCPVDLSAFAPHVLDRAAAVARAYGAPVCVQHVLPVAGVAVVPFGLGGPSSFAYSAMDREQALENLSRLLSLDSRHDVKIDIHVNEAPGVAEEILLQADRVGADLIVLGTHGRSGFDRLVFGSVAEKALRRSKLPVMTVPAHDGEVPLQGEPFRRILFATDFSPGSDAALHYAASLAQHSSAELITLHVVEPVPAGTDPNFGASIHLAAYEAALERDADRRLREAVPLWIRHGCDTTDVLTKGKSHVEILRVAAEREADLIVTSVHGRNAIDRFVFGSTTEQVLRRATCPVLTMRAAEGPRG
jgi:nucleotide-binding universal stress UspA family protein